MESLLELLRGADDVLSRECAGFEAQFLTLGSELEALSNSGDSFVENVERLVSLATGKRGGDSAFSNAIRLVEEATRFLAGCEHETRKMLALLNHYNGEIRSLLKVETELQRTMLPLKFVQTLFKAEAAPMGADIQQMFAALTNEIEGLHGQMRELFGAKFQQLGEVHQTIARVVEQLDAQTRRLREVTTIHKEQIEKSLGTLKKEMASNAERDVRLGRVSKDLAAEVGAVVMGLQFQDILNQKLQHVRAALPEIESRVAEVQRAGATADSCSSLQFLNQSCRLESEQLAAAREELIQSETAIRGGIDRLLGHLTEVDAHGLSLEEFKLLTTSYDGMVEVLLGMMGDARELVATTVGSATAAYETLRPLGGMASDLTGVVRGTSARIRLIGLNAQVQAALAARDRHGAGLEVLSARTNEISEEVNRISEHAAGQLDDLASGLAESVRAFGNLREAGLARQTELIHDGAEEERRLHGFRDEALSALRAIGDSLDSIRDQSYQTLAAVKFDKFYEIMIPNLRAPLIAIAEFARQRLKTQGQTITTANLVVGFKREYTMKSERDVFADVINAGGLAQSEPVGAAPAELSAVELFDDAETLPEGGAYTGRQPKAAPETTASKNPELGANVDLF